MNHAHFTQYFLSSEQVAKMLGCTQKTIEEKTRQGLLPGIKIGRSYRFPIDALNDQLNALARETLRSRTSTLSASEKSFSPEVTSAANDFEILTGSKSISIGKTRKPKAFEFGSTRKKKAA